MIDLELLNKIPRPELYEPWSASDYEAALVCLSKNWRRRSALINVFGASLPDGIGSEEEDYFDAVRTFVQSGWLPIETAPMDGTDVIVYDPRPEWHGDYKSSWCGCEPDEFDAGDPCWRVRGYVCGTDNRLQPSHWRPIPLAPRPGGDL